MNRRIFISKLAFTLLNVSSLASYRTTNNSTFDIYIDESGLTGRSMEPFVIGALVFNINYDHEKTTKIRKQSNYKPRLTYTSSNKYKLNLFNPMFEEFLSNNDMRFFAFNFPTDINEEWPEERKLHKVIYKHNYKKIINSIVNKNINFNIYLPGYLSTGKHDLKYFLEKHFKHNIKINIISETIFGINNDLMELNDVLTGSIYGDITKTSDKTKLKIINIIKNSLKVKDLEKDFSYKGKFNIKTIKTL